MWGACWKILGHCMEARRVGGGENAALLAQTYS